MIESFPLSVGSISLAKLCATTVAGIYEICLLFSRSKGVDTSLSSLADQINLLGNVLKSLSETYAANEDTVEAHPILEQHWANIRVAMADCEQTLNNLGQLLKEITVEHGRLMRRVRTQMGFDLKEFRITYYKETIGAFCRTMQISLQLLNLETAAQGNQNLDAAVNRVETNLSKRMVTIEADVKRLLNFLESGINTSPGTLPPDFDFTAFITNIKKSAKSARSVVFEVRSSQSLEGPPSPTISIGALDETPVPNLSPPLGGPSSPTVSAPEDAETPEIDFPLADLQTLPTSIGEVVSSLDPGADLNFLVIQKWRDKAAKRLAERNYAEAKLLLERVVKRSEKSYGNLYEWKDDTIKMLAISNCHLHRWTEVEDAIATSFNGRDEVLRSLAKEYCAENKTNEALKILKIEFEGRDETLSSIVTDLCVQKKWDIAVNFAGIDFVGREEPLEIVAAGCQQNSMWAEATKILKEILNCKLVRKAQTAETLHALANASLQQKNFTEARDWCRDAVDRRIATVGKSDILFYHTINLLARIYLGDGDPEEAEAMRSLLPQDLLDECYLWDRVSDRVGVRSLVPWVHPETAKLIPCEEEQFNQSLLKLGKDGYLGSASAFQLIHVFAFLRRPLSVLILLDGGVDISAKTDIGANLLHVAASGGDEELVRVLLERGFEANAKVAYGRQLTSLMLASRMGHVAVLSVLAESEIVVNAIDRDGNTALLHSAARGQLQVVQFLLEKGAKTQARNSQGWTALHYAAEGGHAQVILKLLAYGAEVDAVDDEGYSSLFRAVVNEQKEAARILLQHRANLDLKTADGWTVVGAAITEGKVEMVEMLAKCDFDATASVEPGGRAAMKLANDRGMMKIANILSESARSRGKANKVSNGNGGNAGMGTGKVLETSSSPNARMKLKRFSILSRNRGP